MLRSIESAETVLVTSTRQTAANTTARIVATLTREDDRGICARWRHLPHLGLDRHMSLLDSVRVLGAMARVTAPTILDIARGSLSRHSVDERARWFGRRVVELLDIQLS